MRLHDPHQVQGARQVVVIIIQRLFHGLSYGLQPGKVEHCADGMGRKYGVHGSPVAHIRLVKRKAFSCDLLYPVHGGPVGIDQIIHGHNIVAGLQKLHAGVTSDISGCAGN